MVPVPQEKYRECVCVSVCVRARTRACRERESMKSWFACVMREEMVPMQ